MNLTNHQSIKIILIALAIWIIGAGFFIIYSLSTNEETGLVITKDKHIIQCPDGTVAQGIVGTHNNKLITKFGLQCTKNNLGFSATVLAGTENEYGYFKFGPDLCNQKLTGLNLSSKTGRVTQITKICDQGLYKNTGAKILECDRGIKGLEVELDDNGFINDVLKVICN